MSFLIRIYLQDESSKSVSSDTTGRYLFFLFAAQLAGGPKAIKKSALFSLQTQEICPGLTPHVLNVLPDMSQNKPKCLNLAPIYLNPLECGIGVFLAGKTRPFQP